MNIYLNIKNEIIEILKDKFNIIDKSIFNNITCEQPKDSRYGDISSNVIMLISKKIGLEQETLFSIIKNNMSENNKYETIKFVKPGFINIKLTNQAWIEILYNIRNDLQNYGFQNFGKNKKINIEFVSANPTGPIHIGHVRGAVFGDVLAKLLEKNGYDVTKEYYVNDMGNQISLLADTLALHIKNIVNKTKVKPTIDMYKGKYLKKMAEKILKNDDFTLDNVNKENLKNESVRLNLVEIKKDLGNLGIKFDIFTSEKEIHSRGLITEAIEILNKEGYLYWGYLDKPKGKEVDNWSPKKQYLFKSTKFGDNSDRAVKKDNNAWTYFASDIAYHYDKAKRGYEEIVNVWGADHAGYIDRVAGAIKALNFSKLKFTVKLCQIVNLIDNNKTIKMSKREGNYVLLKDVQKKIGKDVLRFYMLTRKNDAQIDFDLEKSLETSKENPIFYVQYAHARISSVKKIIAEKSLSIKNYSTNILYNINSENEINMIKKLSLWPKIIEASVLTREPHRIVYYLIELSSTLHSFWNMGNSNSAYRIINEENLDLTSARLALLEAVQSVISNGLDIISIKPANNM